MLNQDIWNNNLDKIEPNATAGTQPDKPEQAFLASIAMSLKRIADMQEYEQNEKRMADNARWN